MQLNKQRLQLWLDEKVAAYNNGSSQDIEMIKILCRHRSIIPIPNGASKFYVNGMKSWYTTDTIDGMPHHPVSWFFEPDPFEKRIEALEKAVEEIKALINNKK